MTNMDGVGLLFLAFFIGIPLLCCAIVLGYLVHRDQMKKNQDQQIDSPSPTACRSFSDAFRDLIFHPGLFFKRLTEEPVSLYRPFILITVGGIVLSFSYIFSSVGGGITNIVFLTLAGGIILLLFSYIFWIFATLVLYAITTLFKGTGLLIRTAQNIGYAEAFGLIGLGVFMVVAAVIATLLRVSLIDYGPGPGTNSLFVMIITAGFLLITLWIACLMVFGLQYARNLSLAKAAVSVAVPFGIYLVYTYSSYMQILH